MTQSLRPGGTGRTRPAPGRTLTVVLGGALVVAGAAACSSPNSPRVASVGPPSDDGSSASDGSMTASPLAYSQCMRSNRVPNFPDPGSDGQLPKTSAQQLGVSSSQFTSARRACQPLLPDTDPSPVSQPSDALVAQADAEGALNSLFLGLGAISLLVGAIGVGNIMLIAVLERRSEIGLRRALGAAKGHIRIQFLAEAVLLALAGGAAGVVLGALSTAIYAHANGWVTVVPTLAWAGGLAAALLIGAVAGLLPAIRAARMSPTQALWSM